MHIIFDAIQNYTEANRDPDLPELTVKQYYYLEVICKMNNPTYSELAEKFKVTKPAVTAIVNKLIGLGCLQRMQSCEDRRVYNISVSDKGKRLIELNNSAANEFARDIEACLSKEELEQHIATAEKIVAVYMSKKA